MTDRFYLIQNLMEAVEKQVAKEYSALRHTLLPQTKYFRSNGQD